LPPSYSDRVPAGGQTVTVIVPVLNALSTLPVCVDSILAAMEQSGAQELVLVDNGSDDGSYEHILQHYSNRARIVRVPGVRVGEVRNVGAQGVQSDILSFIDSDCVIQPDYFAVLRRVFSDQTIAATGATVSLPPDPGWIERTWDALHAARPRGPAPWMNSGNFAIRRSIFEELGGFDAALTADEDTQFGTRLGRSGYLIFEEPDLVAVHLGNPKTLRRFFRRCLWHGTGIFGRPGARRIVRRSLALLGLHMTIVVAALLVVLSGRLGFAAGIATICVAILAVPAFSVAYRVATSRRRVNLGAALLLYNVYYAARVIAFAKVLTERLSPVTSG
jgi:glycosyltransferase involved in cell wall biosynthesis